MENKKGARFVRTFDSFDDADAADIKLYAAMTPEERLVELLRLLETNRPDNGRIARVVRKYPLSSTEFKS